MKGISKVGGILGTVCLEDAVNGLDAGIVLTQSYNTGVIDCISSYSGGLAGYIEVPYLASAAGAVKIENCYNLGKMRDGGNIAGELAIGSGTVQISKCIGIQIYNSATQGIIDRAILTGGGTTGYCTLSDCYYFSATGEYAFTSGGRVSGTGTSLAASQMKTASSFVNFDFANVWAISASQNQGYPYLKELPVMQLPYAAPAKGTVLNDSSTQGSYKVTAEGLTVTYMGCTNPLAETVTIPSEVEIGGYSYKVTAIASRAFYNNTSLTKVTIPSTVTVINCGAFFKCTSLKTVSGCRGVQKIYKNAFRDCKKLTKLGAVSGRITLKSVEFIGKRAFLGCSSVKTVLLSSPSLHTIGSGAFRNCTSMTKMNISSTSLSHIGTYTFSGNARLATIILHTKALTSGNVGGKAFSGIRTTAVFQVPSAKVSDYKTLFRSKGAGSGIYVKGI